MTTARPARKRVGILANDKPHLIFLDTETTGLDPDRHQIWEIATIEIKNGEPISQRLEQFPVNLSYADPMALTVNEFYERAYQIRNPVLLTQTGIRDWCHWFARRSHGAHIVGAVPDFDTRFLTNLLRENEACPGWHYHLVCVENLLAGRLCEPPPWKSDELYAKAGINRNEYAKHTAMGDCLLAVDIYDLVMGTEYGKHLDRSM